jgi:hypothetical protein
MLMFQTQEAILMYKDKFLYYNFWKLINEYNFARSKIKHSLFLKFKNNWKIKFKIKNWKIFLLVVSKLRNF